MSTIESMKIDTKNVMVSPSKKDMKIEKRALFLALQILPWPNKFPQVVLTTLPNPIPIVY
jgi:hypothetical protein